VCFRSIKLMSRSQPSRPWSFLGFILPFLHLPSMSSTTVLSEGHLALHSMFAALKLAAVPSLVALAAVTPLYMVNTPCLDATSPSNDLGGRTGSLTDMSLLRLLNTLDPSPGSQSTSNQLRLHTYIRALPSTIAPAIGSGRIRLIILLVLIAVLGCGGGLFVIFRTYTAFARYHERFEQGICGGMDMVIIPSVLAEGWRGLSEERIKKWISERGLKGEDGHMSVVGVFGIPWVGITAYLGLADVQRYISLEGKSPRAGQSAKRAGRSRGPLYPVIWLGANAIKRPAAGVGPRDG